MRKKAEKKAEVKIEKKEVKAARKAAKASREPKAAKCSKKSANVLLERTDKVVTRDKDTVLKIFGSSYKVSAVLNEAMNEARAAETY